MLSSSGLQKLPNPTHQEVAGGFAVLDVQAPDSRFITYADPGVVIAGREAIEGKADLIFAFREVEFFMFKGPAQAIQEINSEH